MERAKLSDEYLAIDRAALDGANIPGLLGALSGANPGEALRAYAYITPAQWSSQAQSYLNQVSKTEANIHMTPEQLDALVETYGRLYAAQALMKDPRRAGQPISLEELNRKGREFLESYDLSGIQTQRARIRSLIVKNSFNSQSIQNRFNRLLDRSIPLGEQGRYDNLVKNTSLLILSSLRERQFPDALITQEELDAEEKKFKETVIYKVLASPSNPINGYPTFSNKTDAQIRQDYDQFVTSSPAYEGVVLNGAERNSFLGRSRLAADKLRSDQYVGRGPEVFRQHLAELYVISLYNDGTLTSEDLPSQEEITRQAALIAQRPDFRLAADAIRAQPNGSAEFISDVSNRKIALTGQQFTEILNKNADARRSVLQPGSLVKADLLFDAKAAVMQNAYADIRSPDDLNA